MAPVQIIICFTFILILLRNIVGGPPALVAILLLRLKILTRPLFDSLNHVLQAANHVACSSMDSTVFYVASRLRSP